MTAMALAWGAPAAAADLLPLHVGHAASPAIRDSAGRQVLLRGVNVNGLGDYGRPRPSLPATLPLRAGDFRRMSAFGFDVVRIVVNWSKLEPRRGEFNQAYVARIRKRVRFAAAQGVYSVIDMHQDAWSRYLTPPSGQACPRSSPPAVPWDGAPRWATITDGLSTCTVNASRNSAASQRAFQSFWLDRDGIQSELVLTWRRLAKALAANPAVAGWDLLNEPNPGETTGSEESAVLGDYYRSVIAAIREGEAARRGGFPHIAFFEPTSAWQGASPQSHRPPPGFTDDPNVVYAPHAYAGSLGSSATGDWREAINSQFRVVSGESALYGAPAWVGEYGWFGTPRRFEPRIAYFARKLDAHLWGAAWWQWVNPCGNPAAFRDALDRTPAEVVGNLHRFRCPAGRRLAPPATTARILERPYPRAAPGLLTELRSHPRTAGFRLRGESPANTTANCHLVIWIPMRGKRHPFVRGAGADRIGIRRVRGGWLANACVTGSYRLHGGYRG